MLKAARGHSYSPFEMPMFNLTETLDAGFSKLKSLPILYNLDATCPMCPRHKHRKLLKVFTFFLSLFNLFVNFQPFPSKDVEKTVIC
jgi:hypothetical protein